MQCSVTLERYQTSGNKMKTVNSYKNPYRKEPNLDNIVDQLCTRLQDIKDQDSASSLGMPTCTLEHTEAVRRYYAAFPALKKGQESPLQFYPTPAWCRNTAPDTDIKMQSELSVKDWNSKSKKFSGKERRNSYHGQRKSNRKRCNSYSRSFESKDNLPEWMTHEGVWDIETQDPVKEFIRAIALDEGYGTCENTVTDDLKDMAQVRFAGIAGVAGVEDFVPEWDELDPVAGWAPPAPRARDPMEEELYARFEAKFDRSIEALWSKDQNTPDDEYQDLPIDFQDLLSSPSDRMFADPSAEKCSLISLTDSIWSTDGFAAAVGAVGAARRAARARRGAGRRLGRAAGGHQRGARGVPVGRRRRRGGAQAAAQRGAAGRDGPVLAPARAVPALLRGRGPPAHALGPRLVPGSTPARRDPPTTHR